MSTNLPQSKNLFKGSNLSNTDLKSGSLPSATIDGAISKHSKFGVIAIDGAAGTGKGTLAKNLSKMLDLPVLDTGAIYRSLAYELLNMGVKIGDRVALSSALDKILPVFAEKFSYSSQNGEAKVAYNNIDLTDRIRSIPVSMMASYCSSFPEVREKLLPIQREIALKEERGMIVEGRDIGTRVFPDATVKIFLDGEPLVRAHWRYRQILQKYESSKLPNEERPELYSVVADFLKRDLSDRTRELDPLPFSTPPGYAQIQITGDDLSPRDRGILSEAEVASLAFDIIEKKLDSLNSDIQ